MSPRRPRAGGALLPLMGILVSSACVERQPTPAMDAGADGPRQDREVTPEVAPEPLAVDFTASGCTPIPRGTTPVCAGAAPLAVRFAPILAGPVETLLWSFGDATASTEATPLHLFALPGRYDVTLTIGGRGGSATRTRHGFIEVIGNPLGGRCEVDAQCLEGLRCLCGSADSCAAAFTRGLCVQDCAEGGCPDGSVCVDLSLSGAVTPESPWRSRLCLRACAGPQDCAPGLACRELPGPGQASWPRACFVELPRPAGAACRNTNGLLDQTACVTGVCEDLGALATCAPSCDEAPCPTGTSCALLPGGALRCIPRCSPEQPCTGDPLLSCQPPGRPGPRGFVVPDGPADATYCMPRPCAAPGDCAPAGTCLLDEGGGHCVWR